MARAPSSPQEVGVRLSTGFNVSELAKGFGMAKEDVQRKLHRANDNGIRDGLPVYRLREAAKYLADLPANVVERVIRSNHADLPPMLKKEYWQGQNEQLKVKQLQGDLWRTEDVITYVGTAFRELQMEVRLMLDTVERNTDLTDRQRETITEMIDGTLANMRDRVRNIFKEKGDDQSGRSAESFLVEDDPLADL